MVNYYSTSPATKMLATESGKVAMDVEPCSDVILLGILVVGLVAAT